MSKGSSGGGASLGSGANGATKSDGKHSVSLPVDKRRMTIDQSSAAMKQMGYHIDESSYKFDLASKQSTYSVKLPNGSTQRMNVKEITKLVYAGRR